MGIFKKKQIMQPPVEIQTNVENLIRGPQKAAERQEEQPKTVKPIAQILSTELLDNGAYRNVILSNVLMGSVGDTLELD